MLKKIQFFIVMLVLTLMSGTSFAWTVKYETVKKGCIFGAFCDSVETVPIYTYTAEEIEAIKKDPALQEQYGDVLNKLPKDPSKANAQIRSAKIPSAVIQKAVVRSLAETGGEEAVKKLAEETRRQSDDAFREEMAEQQSGVEYALLNSSITEHVGRLYFGDDFDAAAAESRTVANYCSGRLKEDGTFAKTMRDYANDIAGSDYGACWFCPVFEKMVDVINRIARTTYDTLASDFIGLLGIGVLFVVLFKVARMVVSLQEVDLMQFLNDLIKPLGRAIIASCLLGAGVAAGGQTIFHLLTQPVFDISIKLSDQILLAGLGQASELTNAAGVDGQTFFNDTQAEINRSAGVLDSEGLTGPVQNKVVTEGEKQSLVAWMKGVSSSFTVGKAIGTTLVVTGLRNLFTPGTDGGTSMFLSGFVVWAAFFFTYLIFPFKIVDAFVRLSFVLALMPLWIILWVFDATRKYTVKAWEMFLSSCLLFIVLGIMIALAITLISNIFPGNSADANEVIACLRSDNMKAVGEKLSFGSGLFMNAIAFGAMAFMLLGAAAPIANTFASAGGDINVGNGMAALGGRATGFVAEKTVKGARATAPKVASSFKSVGGAALGAITLGRFGGGSGSGRDNSNPAPETPPPQNGGSGNGAAAQPIFIQGERGERGFTGAVGEQGRQGDRGENGRNAEAPNSIVSENRTRDQEQTRNATNTNVGVERSDNRGDTARVAQSTGTSEPMTSYQQDMASRLAKTDNGESVVRGLAKDTLAIEQMMHLSEPEFKEQLDKKRDWASGRTSSRSMSEYAQRLYDRRNEPKLFAAESYNMISDVMSTQNVAASTTFGMRELTDETAKTMEAERGVDLSQRLGRVAEAIAIKKDNPNADVAQLTLQSVRTVELEQDPRAGVHVPEGRRQAEGSGNISTAIPNRRKP